MSSNLPGTSNDDNLDYFLQGLIELVHHAPDLNIGITLQVSGMLVSGYLTSDKSYFEEGIYVGLAGIHTLSEDIDISQNEKLLKSLKTGSDGDRKFIHLKDARFFNTIGKPIPDNIGIWWRGRLSEVGGFILGSLSFDSLS